MEKEINDIKQKLDFYYEQLRPSKNLRIFLSLYEKYIRLLVEKEKQNDNK